MDAKELKSKLHEGEVEFTYRKKDGSERKARGTLCEKLMPKAVPVRKFRCTNIKWVKCGTENAEDVTLSPAAQMTVNIPTDDLEGLFADEVMDVICDKLNEATDFLVASFDYKELDTKPAKKLPEGTIFYYDLDKGGFRSFNEDQLIG